MSNWLSYIGKGPKAIARVMNVWALRCVLLAVLVVTALAPTAAKSPADKAELPDAKPVAAVRVIPLPHDQASFRSLRPCDMSSYRSLALVHAIDLDCMLSGWPTIVRAMHCFDHGPSKAGAFARAAEEWD